MEINSQYLKHLVVLYLFSRVFFTITASKRKTRFVSSDSSDVTPTGAFRLHWKFNVPATVARPPLQGECWCEPAACVLVQSSGWQQGAPACAKSHLVHSSCQWPQTQNTFAAFHTQFLPSNCWCSTYLPKDAYIDKIIQFPLRRDPCCTHFAVFTRLGFLFWILRIHFAFRKTAVENNLFAKRPHLLAPLLSDRFDGCHGDGQSAWPMMAALPQQDTGATVAYR